LSQNDEYSGVQNFDTQQEVTIDDADADDIIDGDL